MVRAFYSLKRVADMVMAHEMSRGFLYQLVAVARPDTAFLTALHTRSLDELLDASGVKVARPRWQSEANKRGAGASSHMLETIMVPNFHHWGVAAVQ